MRSNLLIFVLFLFTWGLIIFSFYEEVKFRDKVEEEFTRIDSTLKKREHLDSLYRDHLSECSFISNNQVKIGYNGYLQVIE